MNKFKLGDIVRLKNAKDKVYYIITDVADFTQKDGESDVECELMKIYPVSSLIEINMVDQDSLEMIASVDEKENEIIIDFIKKERNLKGLYGEPEFISRIKVTNSPAYQKEISGRKEVKMPVIKKKKVTDADIKKHMEDNSAEKQTEDYLKKLDTHLHLLHIAIQNNQPQEIELQKSQLTKIRQVLMELEYFQLESRRKGDTLTLGQGNRKKK